MQLQHSGGLCPKVSKPNLLCNCFYVYLDGDKYTKIGIGVIIQILEGLHALCYRSRMKLLPLPIFCFLEREGSSLGFVHLFSATSLLFALQSGY